MLATTAMVAAEIVAPAYLRMVEGSTVAAAGFGPFAGYSK